MAKNKTKESYVSINLPIPRPWFNIATEDARLRGKTIQEIIRCYIASCGIVRRRALSMQLLDFDFRNDLLHPDFDIPKFKCFFPRQSSQKKQSDECQDEPEPAIGSPLGGGVMK
jgi:hypothetical protein